MHEHKLTGCLSTPLAGYFKALGVLRLVAEQVDPTATGHWSSSGFVLRTRLTENELVHFFLEEYSPTPIVGPWGARSGFYDGSSESAAREALQRIENSSAPRFSLFAETIRQTRGVLNRLGIGDKDTAKAEKQRLMEACRAWLPDAAVAWLDACYVITEDKASFPPLMGTGGNEGSGSYMSGYAQVVGSCLIDRAHDVALPAALWDLSREHVLSNQVVGHFIPSAGGANASNGFSGKALINPWDYPLCLEGALLFAAGVTRRGDLSTRGAAAFPFTVSVVSAGHGSSAQENCRAELWAPLWAPAITLPELRQLLGEGRARLGKKRARDGLEFARAVSQLGVDRGIGAFERYAFLERNGLSNFAVPLGRHRVSEKPKLSLIDAVHTWLDRFRRQAGSETAPGSVRRALRHLESLLMNPQEKGDDRLSVMLALGACERALAKSVAWAKDCNIKPIPPMQPHVVGDLDDGSPEFRLALALASIDSDRDSPVGSALRAYLEPIHSVSGGRFLEWDPESKQHIRARHLQSLLTELVHRRLLFEAVATQSGHRHQGGKTYRDASKVSASLEDIALFLSEDVDDERILNLLWALSLVDWRHAARPEGAVRAEGPTEGLQPPAMYALVKLAFAGREVRDVAVPAVAQILRLTAAGRGAAASRHASRRLRASALPAMVQELHVTDAEAKRCAAALVFPISYGSVNRLAARMLRRATTDESKILSTGRHEHGI